MVVTFGSAVRVRPFSWACWSRKAGCSGKGAETRPTAAVSAAAYFIGGRAGGSAGRSGRAASFWPKRHGRRNRTV